MPVCAIYGNIHSKVFCPLPVHFDGIQFSKRLYKMLYILLTFPDDGKVVYDERKSNAAIRVSKQRRKVFQLVVPIGLKMLEQAFLG